MKDKEKQLTSVIEKVLRDTQNCDMSIETLTDYLVDRIKDKVISKNSVVLTEEEHRRLMLAMKLLEQLKEDNLKIEEQLEQARKETAEKILTKLQPYIGGWVLFKELEKEYGIEVEIKE